MLNKLQSGRDNSRNFLRKIGGQPLGPHVKEFLDSVKTRLTSSTEKTGVEIILLVRGLKAGDRPSSWV